MTRKDDPWGMMQPFLTPSDRAKIASRSSHSDAPRVVPKQASRASGSSVLYGLAALGLLGLTQGTLAWIALGWAAELGWLSSSPEWGPVSAIAVAVAYIRGFDWLVFRRR